MRKIVIAGGSGFLGRILENHFVTTGDQVTILTRDHSASECKPSWIWWDGKNKGEWIEALEGADVLINLSGKSVDCRYNERNKALIYSSRLESTKVLGQAVSQCGTPPRLWINFASATIYAHSMKRSNSESNGVIGEGFSVDVCQQWEAEFNSWNTPDTRKVLLRSAIVMGREGGVMTPLKNLVRIGMGGSQGDGSQYMSWLHQDDLLGIVEFIIENEHLEGVFNTTAPFPLRNGAVMQALRESMNIGFGLPIPKWVLEIGAVLIDTETELVLKSRWVVPQRLHDEGYRFKYNHIEEAFNDLI
ncbi:TIGR01777 family oxidoreductase [Flavobacteriales bacterium AH-315-E23]|nr:TIGR01777 family oxidoreductase [Flavobacteriales bacterium AH-315-E23]